MRGGDRRVPENLSRVVRVSLAVASSSPPLKVTVPVPNAPPLPKARTPPATLTPPIVFASLSDDEAGIDSEPARNRQRARVLVERGLRRIEGQRIRHREDRRTQCAEADREAGADRDNIGPRPEMVTSSLEVGIVPVDQFAATFQSPLTELFQLMAAIVSLPSRCKRLSALDAGPDGCRTAP